MIVGQAFEVKGPQEINKDYYLLFTSGPKKLWKDCERIDIPGQISAHLQMLKLLLMNWKSYSSTCAKLYLFWGGHTCHSGYVWSSGDNLSESQLSPIIMWTLGVKFQFLVLIVSVFMCWAILSTTQFAVFSDEYIHGLIHQNNKQ